MLELPKNEVVLRRGVCLCVWGGGGGAAARCLF